MFLMILGYNFMGSDISAAFAISKLKKFKKEYKMSKKKFLEIKISVSVDYQ